MKNITKKILENHVINGGWIVWDKTEKRFFMGNENGVPDRNYYAIPASWVFDIALNKVKFNNDYDMVLERYRSCKKSEVESIKNMKNVSESSKNGFIKLYEINSDILMKLVGNFARIEKIQFPINDREASAEITRIFTECLNKIDLLNSFHNIVVESPYDYIVIYNELTKGC